MANLPVSPLPWPGWVRDGASDLAGRVAEGLDALRRLPNSAARWAVGALALVLLAGLLAAGFALYLMFAPVALPEPKEDSRAATTQILGADGSLIEEWHGPINRTFVPLDRISRSLQDAAIATEDARFYQRGAVDLRAVMRAAWANLLSGRMVQGGSTISQQYAKNVYVGNAPTLSRKVKEARVAYRLERELGKGKVLEGYLNTVYFGRGAYGVEAAAKAYFGKPASAVTPAEAALLVGMIRSPDAYSPYEHPERSEARRHYVLKRMERLGFLTPAELAEALDGKPALKPASSAHPRYGWFLDALRTYLLRRYGSEMVYSGGLKVQTTLDPQAQEAAEVTLATSLPDPEDPYAALASIDPATGYVRALVGGRDYSDERYNIALQGRRQPGSAFKPLVLVAALEEGIPPTAGYRAPSTICPKAWRPGCVSNFGRAGYGYMSLERATINSVNTVYAQLVLQVGPKKVVDVARRMGIPGPEWMPPRSGCKPSPEDACRTLLQPVPAMALGAEEVTPLELASVYATLAAGGVYREPKLASRVEDAQGRVLEEGPAPPRQAISPGIADTVTAILTKVVGQGTGTRAGLGRPAAGKTGTAQDFSNAWFTGYTPNLATAVWVGHRNSNRPLLNVHGFRQVAGGTLPAEMWREYMKGVSDRMPPAIVLGEAVADGSFTSRPDQEFAGTASDPDGLVHGVEISVDGAPFTPAGVECRRCPAAEVEWLYRSPAGLADGDHVVEIRSFDKPGHRSPPVARRFRVDTRPPAVKEAKAAGGIPSLSITFDEPVDCASVSPAAFSVSVGGARAGIASAGCTGAAAEEVRLVLAQTVRGGEAIAVEPGRASRLAADRAGNPASGFAVRTVAANKRPVVRLGAQDRRTPVTATGLAVGGAASDPDGTLEALEVSIDGGPFRPAGLECRACLGAGDGAWEYRPAAPLAHGPHTLAFRSLDNAGAASIPEQTRVIVDAVPPKLEAIAASGGSPRVKAGFSEPVSCDGMDDRDFDVAAAGRRLRVDWITCSGAAAQSVELGLATAVRGGDRVTVSLRDGRGPADVAGNAAGEQEASGQASNLAPVLEPVATPPIRAVAPSALTLQGGTTDPDGVIEAIELSVDGGPFSSAGVECAGCREQAASVRWLYRPEGRLTHGPHEFAVRSADNAGVRSPVRKVTVEVDAVAPVVRQVKAAGGSPVVELLFSEPVQCPGNPAPLLRVLAGGRRAAIASVACDGPSVKLSLTREISGGDEVEASLRAPGRAGPVLTDAAGNPGETASLSAAAANQPPLLQIAPAQVELATVQPSRRRPAAVLEGTARDPDGVVEEVQVSFDGSFFSSRGVSCRGCGRSREVSFSVSPDPQDATSRRVPLVRAIDSAGAISGSDRPPEADSEPPRLKRISARAGSSSFTAQFSEALDCDSLNGSDFSVQVDGRRRPVLAVDCTGPQRIGLRISGRIHAGDAVSLAVNGTVQDEAGNLVEPGSIKRFKVASGN